MSSGEKKPSTSPKPKSLEKKSSPSLAESASTSRKPQSPKPTPWPRFADNEYHNILTHLPFLQRLHEIIIKKRNLPYREDLLKELINDPKYVPTKFIVEHYQTGYINTFGVFVYHRWLRHTSTFTNWTEFKDKILQLNAYDYLHRKGPRGTDGPNSNIIKISIENDHFALKYDIGESGWTDSKWTEKLGFNANDPDPKSFWIEKIGDKSNSAIVLGIIYSKPHFIDVEKEGEICINRIIFENDTKKFKKYFKPEMFFDMFVGIYWFIKYLNLNTVFPNIRSNQLLHNIGRVSVNPYKRVEVWNEESFSKEAQDYFINGMEGLIKGTQNLPMTHFLKEL